MKYEKPVVRLIGLDETGAGICSPTGSSDAQCTSGPSATIGCNSTGNLAPLNCQDGFQANGCQNGNTATGGGCDIGTGA